METKYFPCKKLDEVVPVVADGQTSVQCPNCKHYFLGKCLNPNRHSTTDPCPFDGKQLPVKESE